MIKNYTLMSSESKVVGERASIDTEEYRESSKNSIEVESRKGSDVHEAETIYFVPREDWPESYNTNTAKENQLHEQVDRFVTQYRRLFPARKPLFICPLNDCNIPKLVCSYIQPTLLPYSECYDWQSCSAFVADHLHYRPLTRATQVPSTMHAPAEVLHFQSANAFEFSTVLCSFLRGAGYNAFTVSGYATRSVCLNETIRVVNTEENIINDALAGDAMSLHLEEEDHMDRTVQCKTLMVTFGSRYEHMMQEREDETLQRIHQADEEERNQRTREHEQEPSDQLQGRRVHSWVLVLPGTRQVGEPFFIEPSVGRRRQISCPDYLAIESLWSEQNYWINMQTHADSVAQLHFDLYNATHWEYLLLRPAMLTPHPQQTPAMFSEDVYEAVSLLAMPPSWTEPLAIDRARFQQRYPGGWKSTQYYRQKVDRYANYLLRSGLVQRVTSYQDFECNQAMSIAEHFTNRSDRLLKRIMFCDNGSTVEEFDTGRADKLKRHRYNINANRPEDKRVLEYYHQGRQMGLSRQTIDGEGVIEEQYVNRPDHVVRRTITLDLTRRHETSSYDRHSVTRIHDYLDFDKQPAEDQRIVQQTFLLTENRIQVEYYASSASQNTELRHFVKPISGDHDSLIKSLEAAAAADMHDPETVPPHLIVMLHLLRQLVAAEQRAVTEANDVQVEIASAVAECIQRYSDQQRQDEDDCQTDTEEQQQQQQQTDQEDGDQAAGDDQVRQSEQQSNNHLGTGAGVTINYRLYDSDLLQSVRIDRQRLAAKKQAEQERMLAESRDPLADQLRRLERPVEQLTRAELGQLRRRCLASCRRRLVTRAERIQRKFNETSAQLVTEQQRQLVRRHSVSAQPTEEPASTELQRLRVDQCRALALRLQMLQQLMESHKHTATMRYRALRQQLDTDPRLANADIGEALDHDDDELEHVIDGDH